MTTRKKGRSPSRAFSLIETLISAALFFVGLTAIFTTYNTAASLLLHHRHVSRAVVIAEGTLEELIHRYPGDPAIEVGVDAPERRFDRDGRLVAAGGMYVAKYEVDTFAALPGIREIAVEVRWLEAGETKRLRLRTWRS